MKTIVISLLTLSALAALAPSARAEEPTFTTFFEWRRMAPEGTETIVGSTDRNVAISLPPVFAGWTCTRTATISGGGIAWQAVRCTNGDVTASASVVCSTNDAEEQAQNFVIRRKDSHVTFQGLCKSVRNAPDVGF